MSSTADAEVFGEYRVLDVLGHGAMGLVYRAHDPRLDRFVALKIVHPGRVGTDVAKARARLVSEARALARVSHPNVLAVYDVGVHDELVFVALELIDGIDLAQWLRAGRRRWPEVVAVFIEAASGLAAVHNAGLVHRDVKPANILVERAPVGHAFGRVRVADFGIARATESASAVSLPSVADLSDTDRDAPLTEVGRVVGTPAYMALEQHLGLDVGPAADQYALCVALYEALYGKRPFRGDAHAMLQAKTAPPNEGPRSDVPVWLWTIVRRGLAPQPQDRFPSIAALLAALRAGPPRRRWRLALALGVVALVGGSIALSLARDRPCRGVDAQVTELWNDDRRVALEAAFTASTRPYAGQTWVRASESIDAYARDLVAMYHDTCEATRVRHEQSEALFDRRVACLESRRQELAHSLEVLADAGPDAVDQADAVVGSLDPVAACGDVAALEAGVPPPTDAQREAVAQTRGMIAEADALQSAGRTDDAVAVSGAALERARSIDYAPVLVEALAVAGEGLEQVGRVDDATAALDEAIALGLQIGHDEQVARAIAMRTYLAGEYEHDIEAAEKWAALGRARLARIGDPPALALRLHNALGTAYSTAGRHDDALRCLEQGLARTQEDPRLVRAASILHSNIGNHWRLRGDFERARDSYTRSLMLMREKFGDDHPQVAMSEVRLAQLLNLAGHYHDAVAGLRKATAALERMQAPPNNVALAFVDFGLALRNVGAKEESNAAYRRAVELVAEVGDDELHGHVLMLYGHACVEMGIYDAAEAQFRRAIELLEPYGLYKDLANAWMGLAAVRESQSQPDEALSCYRQAVELGSPTNDRVAASALVSIASLYYADGRYEEASAALDRQDAILDAAPVVLPDDRITAAILRVEVMVDGGRAHEATEALDRLGKLLDEARSTAGSQWLGEGHVVLGRARMTRGEHEAGCALIARALDELATTENSPALMAKAEAARDECEARLR